MEKNVSRLISFIPPYGAAKRKQTVSPEDGIRGVGRESSEGPGPVKRVI